MKVKDLEYYVNLDYPVEIHQAPKEDGGFEAEIPLLPGCVAWGASLEELWTNLQEAKRLWIKGYLRKGLLVPEPIPAEGEYSGKVYLRVPRSLHRALAERAAKEGVSLNQLGLAYIARGLGSKHGSTAGKRSKSPTAVGELQKPLNTKGD
ncbi:MAG: type II toxin-antitoxin system HicB family antitoxin [Deinococcus sp.]|nr:type II toxin-antitoxin system HicB family antitoxin [Deinococcus sp.]